MITFGMPDDRQLHRCPGKKPHLGEADHGGLGERLDRACPGDHAAMLSQICCTRNVADDDHQIEPARCQVEDDRGGVHECLQRRTDVDAAQLGQVQARIDHHDHQQHLQDPRDDGLQRTHPCLPTPAPRRHRPGHLGVLAQFLGDIAASSGHAEAAGQHTATRTNPPRSPDAIGRVAVDQDGRVPPVCPVGNELVSWSDQQQVAGHQLLGRKTARPAFTHDGVPQAGRLQHLRHSAHGKHLLSQPDRDAHPEHDQRQHPGEPLVQQE